MDQALGDHSTKISSVISQTYVDKCNQEELLDPQVRLVSLGTYMQE